MTQCRDEGCKASAAAWGSYDGFCPKHAEERRRTGRWHTPPLLEESEEDGMVKQSSQPHEGAADD